MTVQETDTVDVNGVTIELPGRRAVANYHMRIGDRVKVLINGYSGAEVFPGVVIGFEPFKQLPTIVIAYATRYPYLFRKSRWCSTATPSNSMSSVLLENVGYPSLRGTSS